jgi:hypothetical protein
MQPGAPDLAKFIFGEMGSCGRSGWLGGGVGQMAG